MGLFPLSRPTAPRQRESPLKPRRVGANLPGESLRFRHARSTFVQNTGTVIQTVCKPGSVRTLAGAGRPFIWDGCCHPPLATNPGGKPEIALRPWLPTAPAAPIRSCSRWGLPCPFCYQKGGALLPHPFTLTQASLGGLLSVALSLGSPPPAVSRHRISVEPGLSSGGFPPATVRPSGPARCLRPIISGVNKPPKRRSALGGGHVSQPTEMITKKMPLKRQDDIFFSQPDIVTNGAEVLSQITWWSKFLRPYSYATLRQPGPIE